jgi:F0F1-type ATP synthase assembly protein I
MPADKKNPKDNVWVAVSRYTSMAFILPVSTFVGYLIGYLLDKVFHTRFLYIVFLLLGIVAGFLQFFRELNEETKNNDGD